MSEEALQVDREGAVATLTLVRPELMNRIDARAHVELTRELPALASARDVRAVVLASRGNVFSRRRLREWRRIAGAGSSHTVAFEAGPLFRAALLQSV